MTHVYDRRVKDVFDATQLYDKRVLAM